jgi:hypothetical protein
MTPAVVFLLVALFLALLGGAALWRAWTRLRRSQQRAEDSLEQLGAESLDLVSMLEPSRAPPKMAPPLYDLERNLDLRVCPRQLFVVHGFPKTGNSTLAATIGALDICDFLYGGHHFSDAGVAALHRAVGNIADPALRSRQLAYYYECARFNRIFRDQRWLQAQIRADGDAPMRPFVVTSMRDPIQMFLSGMLFVHDCLSEPPAPPTAEVLLEAAFGKSPRSPEATFWRELWFQTICGRVDDGAPWYGEIDRWFEHELGTVFGIDAFATPFPHERGWISLESDAARGLLVRQEDFDRLEEILRAWFGLPDGLVRMVDDNRAEGRPNADLYRQIRETFRAPAEQLDAVYATRAARHFYSPAEIEDMKARWGA